MPTDLPPWLTGEQDRGFLQGAQLGITAARTGTEIAQTRQQMRESGELQPFRVAAAEIGNRLQRQQVDLGAAMFPLKIQQAELANQMAGLQVTSQGYGNTLKSIEVDQVQADLPKWMEFQADPTAEKATRFTSPVFQRQAGAVLDFKSKTNVEQAAALSRNAFSTSLKELAEMAPERVPYVTSLLKDGMPTGEAFDQLGTEIAKARLSKQATEEQNKLGLFQGQQEIIEKRQLVIAKENNAAKAANIQSRASTINQTLGVNQRKVFDAKMKVAVARGDLEEQDRIIREFENVLAGGETAEPPPSPASKLVADATEAYNQAYVDGKTKELPELKAKVTRAKVLELKAAGKVFDPDDQTSWKTLKEGELVVFPPNLNSTRAEERVEHVRVFSEKTIKEVLGQKAGLLEKAIRADEAARARGNKRGQNLEEFGKTYTGQF